MRAWREKMQSAALMLAHIGEVEASRKLQQAIEKVYAERRSLTGDVGGSASTDQFTDAVVRQICGNA